MILSQNGGHAVNTKNKEFHLKKAKDQRIHNIKAC
jgi:hypothetical protein